MIEEQNNNIHDMIHLGGVWFSLAVIAHVIRAGRANINGKFNTKKFVASLLAAGFVGELTGWLLSMTSLSFQARGAIVGMIGYVGGPVLDVCYDEVLRTVRAAFHALRNKLSGKKAKCESCAKKDSCTGCKDGSCSMGGRESE